MTLLRLLVVTMVIALGTVLVGWWVVPVVGAVYGVVVGGTERPGLLAATAGTLGWGGYLGLMALGDAPVAGFGRDLSASLGLPGGALLAATLVYPALLAGSAAYLGAGLTASMNAKPRKR